MGFYRIADLTVEIQNQYSFVTELCAGWECTPGKADIKVSVSKEQIDAERARSKEDFSDGYLESVCVYRDLCLCLPHFDGFLLHASTFTIDEYAYGLCAASGTGKSTHTRLLKELLGPRMDIVNGDKPIIRFRDGKPIVYGTPWCGKEKWGKNRHAPLRGLVFLERSEENHIEPIPALHAARRLMHQIVRPSDPATAIKTLELSDRMLSVVSLWRLGCNISREAAELSYQTITGGIHED